MARLVSINGQCTLGLVPVALESSLEDWVVVYLRINAPKERFETTGAFLQRQDLDAIMAGIEQLLHGMTESFELEPLEPEFRFEARSVQKDVIEVTVRYQEVGACKPHEDARRGSAVCVHFATDTQQMEGFARELGREMAVALRK